MLTDIPMSINDYHYDMRGETQEVSCGLISCQENLAYQKIIYPHKKESDYSLSTKKIDGRNEILNEINKISKLKNNWDALGADEISEKCINNIKTIISGLYHYVPSPEIYPNPNGTVTLDWETSGQLVSIEIGDENYSTYWEMANETKMDSETFKGKIPNFLFIALQHMYKDYFKEEYTSSFH